MTFVRWIILVSYVGFASANSPGFQWRPLPIWWIRPFLRLLFSFHGHDIWDDHRPQVSQEVGHQLTQTQVRSLLSVSLSNFKTRLVFPSLNVDFQYVVQTWRKFFMRVIEPTVLISFFGFLNIGQPTEWYDFDIRTPLPVTSMKISTLA